MLGSISTDNSKISSAGLHRIQYLVGEYNVLVYSYHSEFWSKVGSGASIIKASDKLVTEKIELLKGGELVSMNNTFGYQGSEDYKMMALDLTSGSMDVYSGKIEEENLIFCNLQSSTASSNEYDSSFCFKLIYNQLSEEENQVVIGRSEDGGKTWVPYLKTVYKRK